MKKRVLVVFLVAALASALCLCACSSKQEAPAKKADEPAATVDGSAYGYAGDDPIECAVYKYLAEEVSKNFDKAEICIPTVNIVAEDLTNPKEAVVYGDFWVENYNVNGDTLECVSGGNFPGVMHVAIDGDSYEVTEFEMVEDGAGFDESAKELFGDNYDAFMKVYSDDDARDELRKITVSDYVNLNGVEVTQFQDYGWDPVELYLNETK